MPSIPRHRLSMLKREHSFHRLCAMRRLVLLLALAVSACQGRNLTSREWSVEGRERELLSLEEKRKDAIFDLSKGVTFSPRR